MQKPPERSKINAGIPVPAQLVRTAIAPFFNPRELTVRRVRCYDLFYKMQAHVHRNVLKECMLDRIIKPPPQPNAVWSAIHTPFERVPEPLVLMVGWHITPFDAFLIGVGTMAEFSDISCLLLTFTDASTFETDAWILQRKSKGYRLKGWLLGGAAVIAFMLMLSRIASLFVGGVEIAEGVGAIGNLLAWFGFSYLYLTRR